MHNNVYKNAWADRLWPIRPVRRTTAAARVPSKPAYRVSPPCQAVQKHRIVAAARTMEPVGGRVSNAESGIVGSRRTDIRGPFTLASIGGSRQAPWRGRLARRGAGTGELQKTITVDTRRRAQAATDRRIERIAARSDLWFEEPGVPIPPTPARNQSRRSGACVLSRGAGAGAKAGRVRQSPSAPRRSAPLVDEADQIKTREQRRR
jgi:hypothetical protein